MHPIAIYLGSVPLYWYGVMVALGFIAGLWTAGRRGVRAGLRPQVISDIGPWVLLGALVGARVLYVATHWPEFTGGSWVDVVNIRKGGLVFYGGLIGSSLATILYARVRRVPLWKLADALAPSIALGAVFGRMGCLLNGCCWGAASELPWAICFPSNHESGGAPVHPVQVYDASLNLALYGALAWLHRRKQFDGQVFAAYVLAYPLARSLAEMFRGDYPPAQRLFGALTPAHVVSIVIFLIGLALFFVLKSRQPQSGKTA